MKNADDMDMWMRIAYARKKFCFIDEALHKYRKHNVQISSCLMRRWPSVNILWKKRMRLVSAAPNMSDEIKRFISRKRSKAYKMYLFSSLKTFNVLYALEIIVLLIKCTYSDFLRKGK